MRAKMRSVSIAVQDGESHSATLNWRRRRRSRPAKHGGMNTSAGAEMRAAASYRNARVGETSVGTGISIGNGSAGLAGMARKHSALRVKSLRASHSRAPCARRAAQVWRWWRAQA